METVVELVGAVMLLSAFALSQTGRMGTASPSYLLLNFLGSGILAVVAAIDGDVGFLLLEGVWAAVSAVGVAKLVLR